MLLCVLAQVYTGEHRPMLGAGGRHSLFTYPSSADRKIPQGIRIRNTIRNIIHNENMCF